VVGTLALLLLLAAAPGGGAKPSPFVASFALADSLIRPGETHFAHLWQVTTDGQSACPRWSHAGDELVLESRPATGCSRIMLVRKTAPAGIVIRDVAGTSFATCPSFLGPGSILYSVAKSSADSCQSSAQRWRDAMWRLYPGSTLQTGSVKHTSEEWVNTALGAIECATSPDGKTILYTASPAEDAEIYAMDASGLNARRLTTDHGYDGGACFSSDGQSICYQAYHPREEVERAQYDDLLSKGLFDSSHLDIWVMHADGSGRGQVTDLEATSMQPSFTPDSKRIIFSSDYRDPQGRQFDLYITKLDGGVPEKITNDPSPDCFPMFSPDGRYLAFTSGRGGKGAGAQNVFIAEWK
jgi:Tol biopolymer transport system component